MRSQHFFGSVFYGTIVISYCQEISTSSNDLTTVVDVDYDERVYDMLEDNDIELYVTMKSSGKYTLQYVTV